MNAHIKPRIRYIGVVNFGNSPAIACNFRLDVTTFGFNLPRPELIEVPMSDIAYALFHQDQMVETFLLVENYQPGDSYQKK